MKLQKGDNTIGENKGILKVNMFSALEKVLFKTKHKFMRHNCYMEEKFTGTVEYCVFGSFYIMYYLSN